MINIRKTFKEVFNNKVDALGLSVFRLLYALVLFCETSQLFRYRHIIYDKDPFVSVGEIDATFIFLFWFIVLGMLMLGLYTRFATVLNYIFGVIIFSSAKHFEYHIFYAYVGVNFLLMFMPVSRVFSLDSLRRKIKYSSIGFEYKEDRKILEINYLVPVFSAIALVYFDSIFQKLSSPMWRSGLGMWLPSSLPMITWNDTSIILNQEWLMKFLGYFVILFETLFIFLFWIRPLRVPLMIIGIVFHVGILFVYPIPWFAITLIVVYLLMLPEEFWLKLSSLFKSNNPNYTLYYDEGNSLWIRIVIVIKHLDVFNRVNCLPLQKYAVNETVFENLTEKDLLINIHGVSINGKIYVGYDCFKKMFKQLLYTYPLAILMSIPGLSLLGKKIYFKIFHARLTLQHAKDQITTNQYRYPPSETQDYLVLGWNKLRVTKLFWKMIFFGIILIQCLLILISPTALLFNQKAHLSNRVPSSIYSNINGTLKNYFGILHHAVFMDRHFNNYKNIYRISYVNEDNKEQNLPLWDENGLCHGYLSGINWIYLTFRVGAPWNIKPYNLENGFSPYLKYYKHKNKIKKSRLIFRIYVKQIDIPSHWEKDFLHKQIKKPWKLLGESEMNDNVIQYKWNELINSVH